jgi:hypothetical protein
MRVGDGGWNDSRRPECIDEVGHRGRGEVMEI